MPTEDAYSSGHLVLSHFGTCMCSNVETNLSWTCLVSGLLNFEHPSVLLFCLRSKVVITSTEAVPIHHTYIMKVVPCISTTLHVSLIWGKNSYSIKNGTWTGICHGTIEIVPQEVLWSIWGSHQTLWSLPLPNVTWQFGTWPCTMTTSMDQTLH